MKYFDLVKTLGMATAIATLAFATPSYALRESIPLPTDNRFHVVNYHPNDVFKFTGHYKYQSIIEFGENESIDTVTMGDTLSWQIVPDGNRLFLKPIEPDAVTNMTVITTDRKYHFELHAADADAIDSEGMIFELRFRYPEDDNGTVKRLAVNYEPDLTQPEKYNFNYSLSGSEYFAPVKVFDDHEFTYFRFRNKNAELPAIFVVKPDGYESIVNYRVQGNYIVVERVASQYTLRSGEEVVCVYNETMPMRVIKKK